MSHRACTPGPPSVAAPPAPRAASTPPALARPPRVRQVRKRKQVELQAMINEKKAELERLNTQHDSLVRVDAEQKALIEKLTNNEA